VVQSRIVEHNDNAKIRRVLVQQAQEERLKFGSLQFREHPSYKPSAVEADSSKAGQGGEDRRVPQDRVLVYRTQKRQRELIC
jgi:hypothetical protein